MKIEKILGEFFKSAGARSEATEKFFVENCGIDSWKFYIFATNKQNLVIAKKLVFCAVVFGCDDSKNKIMELSK